MPNFNSWIEEEQGERHYCNQRSGMEMEPNRVELDFEMWPVLEHPLEPPDEDRPVKCPMPESSIINIDEGKHEKRLVESLRNKGEVSATMNKDGTKNIVATERPIRTFRKRHHNHGDNAITPLPRMPPLPPLKTQCVTIYQMLQQFENES